MLLRPPPLKGDWKVADTPQAIARKRADYLQLMRKARQANDPVLVKMLVKKLAGLGMVNAVSTVGGCTVIPFPTIQTAATPSTPEQPLWWVLIKLTLAIPGSLAALFMLSLYSYG